ncbi:hypothetical protein DFJ58DRAFT_769209 [Suillus subalutaceus]|uniref:uncharacterized protein n=1 Tax=Suillus subalutaceus TaxID=48586 RepID=UPI001B85E1B5|nr:uncharacterized protein DFJ58DRAFT_769209 [Suillus subalutaceus]KAG1867258.1 hypothetical protein DFJ58DRAFT_769209 [Suillus subalutaceus]
MSVKLTPMRRAQARWFSLWFWSLIRQFGENLFDMLRRIPSFHNKNIRQTGGTGFFDAVCIVILELQWQSPAFLCGVKRIRTCSLALTISRKLICYIPGSVTDTGHKSSWCVIAVCIGGSNVPSLDMLGSFLDD